ncbi:hypothetical protein TGMAS_415670 [Toxoplasma gondii MAS]|uniref:Uncharacterized protein n=1 Tax=Toxoplasma gondii MAS TaxID=943118 RepID=A0A086Q6E4_TOXGO|nr:hypothetical protein TGMAS_415670 [Toxoplasma gondii MAS]
MNLHRYIEWPNLRLKRKLPPLGLCPIRRFSSFSILSRQNPLAVSYPPAASPRSLPRLTHPRVPSMSSPRVLGVSLRTVKAVWNPACLGTQQHARGAGGRVPLLRLPTAVAMTFFRLTYRKNAVLPPDFLFRFLPVRVPPLRATLCFLRSPINSLHPVERANLKGLTMARRLRVAVSPVQRIRPESRMRCLPDRFILVLHRGCVSILFDQSQQHR